MQFEDIVADHRDEAFESRFRRLLVTGVGKLLLGVGVMASGVYVLELRSQGPLPNWFNIAVLGYAILGTAGLLMWGLADLGVARRVRNLLEQHRKNRLTLAVDDDIRLRQLGPKDADCYFELIESNREEFSKWLRPKQLVESREAAAESLERRQGLARAFDVFPMGIWYRGRLVGEVELQFRTEARGVIAYWLDVSHRGKGIMYSSCARMIDYAFNVLGWHRLEITCEPENDKSAAVPKRLGFVHEGTLRGVAQKGDDFIDLDVYGLLEDEWAGSEARS